MDIERPRPAPAAPESVAKILFAPLVEFDRRRVEWSAGLVAAAVISVPIVLALTTPYTSFGVLAALGAFNVLLGEGVGEVATRRRHARWALALNALGIALGTLAVLAGPLQLVAVAVAIGGLQLANLLPGARSVALTACALAAIGIGLPDPSVAGALVRALVVVIGGAWGLGGSELGVRLQRRWATASRGPAAGLAVHPIDRHEVARAALAVGVAAALAFGVGEWIGLPRDYWTVLTVVVVVQIHFLATVSSAVVRVSGTIVGAIAGAALSVTVVVPAALAGLIAAFSGLTLATRAASPSVYVIFLTPFVLLVLGIAYPNGWSLAASRVLDTLIGGAFALGASALLWLTTGRLLRNGAARPS